jgi:hypothetical protein
MLNQTQIVAIRDRVRQLLEPASLSPDELADRLDVPAQYLVEILSPSRDVLIRADHLIDVIAAVVHVHGVDPTWVITGEYDPKLHRSLELEGPAPTNGVRRLVESQLDGWHPGTQF